MKKSMKFIMRRIALIVVAVSFLGKSQVVKAEREQDIRDQIHQQEDEIDELHSKIDSLTDEQDMIDEVISDLNAEILNTMTSIGMKEDEIALKENEILKKQAEITQKEEEYIAARKQEDKQQEDMQIRIRRMYEYSDASYITMLLKGQGLRDTLNRMDYIEKICAYDRKKLEEYDALKKQVRALWEKLVSEKALLQEKQAQLEEDRMVLQEQKTVLESMLEDKKEESANFDAEIKRYRQEAIIAKKLLQQELRELQRVQEEKRREEERKKEEEKNSVDAGGSENQIPGTDVGGSENQIPGTDVGGSENQDAGSELGRKIADYACQFIGNPYVTGGTSLTNGVDCSGFTYRVFSDFGYQLPRTSYQQRSTGVEVPYDQAQVGDLVCYEGHVGIYIGNSKIVHASSVKNGIKITNAKYRKILCVRRII